MRFKYDAEKKELKIMTYNNSVIMVKELGNKSTEVHTNLSATAFIGSENDSKMEDYELEWKD